MKKILLIGSQHGNELLGIRLYEYLKSTLTYEKFRSVQYVCANPAAFARNVRFIESDLNRSFNGMKSTTEERRAAELLNEISEEDFDYILDIHTSTSKENPFFISPTLNATRRKIIAASSSIHTVVIMPAEISKNSLMGQYENSLSIEVNELDATQEGMLELLKVFIENLLIDKEQIPQSRDLFYINGLLLDKDIEQNETPVNYLTLKSGNYPILYGEVNYRGYLGFKADRKDSIRL